MVTKVKWGKDFTDELRRVESPVRSMWFTEEQARYLGQIYLVRGEGEDFTDELRRALDLLMATSPKWKPEGKCGCYGDTSTCTGHDMTPSATSIPGGIYREPRYGDGPDIWVCGASLVLECYCHERADR